MSPDPRPSYDSWDDVMAALETANLAARDFEFDEPEDVVGWVAPTHLGPMPSHLHDRAHALLSDQRDSIRELTELQRETARHLAAVRSVPSAVGADQSVYLNVFG